jgi:hypothetical protein
MEKSCANHPESMALATCKACDKSVCLMCVVDEKEGTFCSTECHVAFSSGQEVPKYAPAAAEPVAASSGHQKLESIFDDEPAPAQASTENLPLPPDEAIPIVAEGTKWRSIGAQCDNHADTPAVANCDRCGKAVCALCLLEASQGTFCSAECMSTVVKQATPQAAPAERAALQGKPVYHFKAPPKTFSGGRLIAIAAVVLLLAGGGYYGWVTLSPEVTTPTPTPPDTTRVNPTNTTVTKPDTTKPDTTKTTKPDTTKPDTTKTTKPDTTKPDTTKPDTTKTDTTTVPRPKTPPKPVAIRTRTLNPWEGQDPGTWYRIRTIRGSQVQYSDVGLKEKGRDYYVLATQNCVNGQPSVVSESKTSLASVVLKGEETFKFEERTYLCEIQATSPDEGAPRIWALLSGKNAGAVLKSVSPETTMIAKRVWDHTLRVKNELFDCLVVEAQVQSGASTRTVKSWYCGSLPLGVAQQEKDGESIALIDLGSDWSKRPAFPK